MKKFLGKSMTKRTAFTVFILLLLLIPSGIIIIRLNKKSVLSDTSHYTNASNPIPTPDTSSSIIIRDNSSDIAFELETVQEQPTSAQFYLYVPQTGYYSGTIPLLLSGAQIIHPQGTVNGQFIQINGGVPTAATIKLEGEIDTVHNTASLNIWANGVKYHLELKVADIASAAVAAKQQLTDLVYQNWTALYMELASEIKTSVTQAQYIQTLSTGTAPTIIAADLNGTGKIVTASGYTFFIQPVTLTARKQDGTTGIYHCNYYFVQEQGTWRFLSSDNPAQ